MDKIIVKPRVTLPPGQTLFRVSYNRNGLFPALSEYIAFDTLTPPNPFIAVTQDGLGRVVYDGGFPKFYNNVVGTGQTTFAQLPAQLKYLHNAILWVMNPAKVAGGNRKVLAIGDATTSENYTLGRTRSTDFTNMFTTLGPILNVEFTVIARLGTGPIDYSFDYLNQFAAVLFMGSAYHTTATAPITQRFIDAMVAYRAAGNGIIFITDHGDEVSTIEQAATNSVGFFASINRISVNFGAWFTGLYDRVPVNVGFIRANYGDHPLYVGLDNSETILAGDSESAVRVTTDTSTKVLAHRFYGLEILDRNNDAIRAAYETNEGGVFLVSIDVDITPSSSGLFGTALTAPANYVRNLDITVPVNLIANTVTDLGTYRFNVDTLSLQQFSGPGPTRAHWAFRRSNLNP